jgi:hypothetical protein
MNISNVPKRNAGAAVQREVQLGQGELEKLFGGPVSTSPSRIANSPRLFHGKFADHLWCGCCKRAFPNGMYRQVGEFRKCPYADCDGHASVDAMPWERIKAGNPDYPETPAVGKHYPMQPPAPPARSAFF